MKSIRIFCVSLITLLFFTSANAQGNKPSNDPVFKVSFSKKNPVAGDIIEIILTADIPAELHMYSTYSKCEFGPEAIELEFNNSPSSGYCLSGKPYSVGDQKKFDDIFGCEVGEFHDKAEIRQKIKVLGGPLTVKGTIKGQWCDEGQCYRFGYDKPLTINGSIASVNGKPVACDEKPSDKIEPVDSPSVSSTLPPDSSSNTPTNNADSLHHSQSYKITGDTDTGHCIIKTFNGQSSETEQESYWGLFIIAFLSGLAGLLTPCVFPMIPMTVSFFLKDKKSRKKAIMNGIVFGVSIVSIYVLLGTIVSFALGADAGNFIATHWAPNILFFIIFTIFAFSFFGAFEIVLPSRFANTVDREADKGGIYGIFFMALTLAIVSFSCTGPIVGSVLVESAKGNSFLRPVIAMLGFGLAFALPFSLFAIFPSWLNSLPKSGGWLNSVKVCFGFIELALGLKFLSTADQTYHWHLLDREVYLVLWIVIFALMGIYLLGKLKFAHDSDLPYIKVPRLLMAITTFAFVVYMIPGLWGAPLKFLSGYLPPMSTQDFDMNRIVREANGLKGNVCKKPSYSDKLHIPHGLNGYFDYDEAMSCAKELKKPLFIDFTGHGCVNCRKMEEKVWSDPRVLKILNEDYVIASLYVDDKVIKLPAAEHFKGRYSNKVIRTLGEKNTEIQLCYFGSSSQPLYCLMDGKEELLQMPVGSTINNKSFDTEEFLKFLEEGLKEFKKRTPAQ